MAKNAPSQRTCTTCGRRDATHTGTDGMPTCDHCEPQAPRPAHGATKLRGELIAAPQRKSPRHEDSISKLLERDDVRDVVRTHLRDQLRAFEEREERARRPSRLVDELRSFAADGSNSEDAVEAAVRAAEQIERQLGEAFKSSAGRIAFVAYARTIADDKLIVEVMYPAAARTDAALKKALDTLSQYAKRARAEGLITAGAGRHGASAAWTRRMRSEVALSADESAEEQMAKVFGWVFENGGVDAVLESTGYALGAASLYDILDRAGIRYDDA